MEEQGLYFQNAGHKERVWQSCYFLQQADKLKMFFSGVG